MNYFDRVPMRWRPAIEAARALLPVTVRQLIEPRFLVGVSPRFVGLHAYDPPKTRFMRTHTYDDTAHACWTNHVPDGKQTIVFPRPENYGDPVSTIVHEYAHRLDEAIGFPLLVPETTDYSTSNRWEAFAEAFTLMLRPPTGEWEARMDAEDFRPLRDAMGML